MATAYVYTLDHIDDTGSPAVAATAEYGDNGPENGPDPEFTLLSASETSSGRTTWQAGYQPDGSWDTGEVPVSMTLTPGPNDTDIISWEVNGEEALTQDISSIGSISSVEVIAATQINGSVQWSNVNVTFSNDTTTDPYASGSSPSVDTTTSDNATAEQELWVEPTATNDTSVTVTGDIRFTLPPDETPNPYDLMANVQVFN